jgi:hypothetical protein
MKLPPPATEFIVPASPAATKSKVASGRVMESSRESNVAVPSA